MPKSWTPLPGEIDIGFPTGGSRDDRETCRLTLHDATSRVVLFELEMDITVFFRAILGRGRSPVMFEAHPQIADYIGATKEQKTIPVFVPEDLGHVEDVETKRATGRDWSGNPLSKRDVETLDLIDKVLGPYERDGWRGSASDVMNWHRVVQDIPTGAAAQLREEAGFAEDARGTFRNVGFSRWLRPNGKVVP
jgi:hypothetical protein